MAHPLVAAPAFCSLAASGALNLLDAAISGVLTLCEAADGVAWLRVGVVSPLAAALCVAVFAGCSAAAAEAALSSAPASAVGGWGACGALGGLLQNNTQSLF